MRTDWRWRWGVNPEHFTSALPKAQRKSRIFVDLLHDQRGATPVVPDGSRAREGAPVAVPIDWKETAAIDKPSHRSLGHGAGLLKRPRSKGLAGWSRAHQLLSDLQAERHEDRDL